jgi:hypothetical protein
MCIRKGHSMAQTTQGAVQIHKMNKGHSMAQTTQGAVQIHKMNKGQSMAQTVSMAQGKAADVYTQVALTDSMAQTVSMAQMISPPGVMRLIGPCPWHTLL